VITGEVGAGKTVAVRAALAALDCSRPAGSIHTPTSSPPTPPSCSSWMPVKCATRRWIDREVVRDRLPQAVAAAREKLGAARSGERRWGWQAAPTKTRRAGTARRRGLVEQGQKVQRERTSGWRPVTSLPARIWWIWAGMQCTAITTIPWRAFVVVVDSEAVFDRRWGGRVEGLRRRRGDAAGVELGASLTDRSFGERGNHPALRPPGPGSRSGSGGRPVSGRGALGWGGGPV